MPKGTILQDTFEQLAELGVSTAKKTVKSVAQTLNPLASPEKSADDPQKIIREKLSGSKDNHTPLDFKSLQNNYEKNDTQKADTLRRHLFNLVHRADEKTLMDSRQKEMEKKRQEVYVETEKKRRKEEKSIQGHENDVPKGKSRKSIFSQKKVAQQQHSETKPATGKQ